MKSVERGVETGREGVNKEEGGERKREGEGGRELEVCLTVCVCIQFAREGWGRLGICDAHCQVMDKENTRGDIA